MDATPFSAGRKALFLDRDGVINVDKGYLCRAEDFEFIDGVFDTLRSAQRKGYLLIVITNQSGIGRGYYTDEAFHRLNDWMLRRFAEEAITISKVYYCPHAPEAACECRKPFPGMITAAAGEFVINLKSSLLIGDKESDIIAGKNAGVGLCVLVRGGRASDETTSDADRVVDSITDLRSYL